MLILETSLNPFSNGNRSGMMIYAGKDIPSKLTP